MGADVNFLEAESTSQGDVTSKLISPKACVFSSSAGLCPILREVKMKVKKRSVA